MNVLDTVLDKLNTQIPSLSDTITNVGKALSGSVTYQRPDDAEKPQTSDVSNILAAIRNNETGIIKDDPYGFRKFSGDKAMGDDIGAYQVTTGELKSWSKEFLGEQVDPDQFAKSPELQDKYMTAKVSALAAAGATPAEIFAIHRGGLTNYADPAVRKQKVTARQDYVNKALDFKKTLDDTEETN